MDRTRTWSPPDLRVPFRWSFLFVLSSSILVATAVKVCRLPTSAAGYYNRATHDAENANYDVAISNLTRAIALDPNAAPYFTLRGLVRSQIGDHEGAISDYSDAIRLDPSDTQAHAGRGYVAMTRRDYRTAISDYTRAIRLDPDSADAHRQRGEAREKTGDEDGALADYAEAVHLDPANGDHLLTRAALYVQQGRWRAALRELRRARERFEPGPDLDQTSLLMWSARARLGDLSGAAAGLRAYLTERSRDGADDWFATVAAVLVGDLTVEAFLASADPGSKSASDGRQCEAYFHAAARRTAEGDWPGAVGLLRRSLAVAREDCAVADRAKAELRDILLGLQANGLDPVLRSSSTAPARGLRVTRVRQGGPAARAGVRRGDALVTIDGAPVDAEALTRVEQWAEPGSRAVIEFIRDGETERVTLTLGNTG